VKVNAGIGEVDEQRYDGNQLEAVCIWPACLFMMMPSLAAAMRRLVRPLPGNNDATIHADPLE